jgi:3-methylfumaryl-CoA hydratase
MSVRGTPLVTEEQNIVYREAAKPGAGTAAPAAQPAPGDAAWRRTVVPDAVMVFRYSALTYNGHRIHYDTDYTKSVEGYPERVVNGGLTTLLLLEHGRAHLGRPLKALETRNLKPLFVDQPITLCGRTDGNAGALWVLDADGALALSATVALA